MVPSSAHMVVIMMGRKRCRQPSKIASSAGLPVAARHDREIDHHDRVLLHDADQQDDADKRVEVQIVMEDQQA